MLFLVDLDSVLVRMMERVENNGGRAVLMALRRQFVVVFGGVWWLIL